MVTIRDVAREAGVSVATVSRVYNDSELVSEDTRRHVREVGTRLRYSPNRTARSLTTAKTNSIGVLLPDIYGEFFSEVIRGIDESAQRRGYHLLVSSSHAHTAEIDVALRAMRGRVDGLILMWPTLDRELVLPSLPDEFPVVLLNSVGANGTFDSLRIDNFTGARAMVEHLIRLGHRRIGMIKGAAGNHDAAERLRGYRAALRAARIETDRAWEVAGDFSEQSGWQGALALLDLTPRPTAIFAANDSMAIGVLSALGERGLRVPGDVAVAGFDDIPMARYMNPPLSSVHVEIAALGAEATRMLLDRVEHKTDGRPKQKTLPTRLVVRSSCGGASPPDDDSGAGRNRSSRAPRRQAS